MSDLTALDRDGSPEPAPSTSRSDQKGLWTVALLSLAVAVLWQFPRAWYTKSDRRLGQYWLMERTNVAGWDYREIPVGKSAEAALVADRLLNGEFTRADGLAVRVFSAKRFSESQNEIGLFVHTPDRCWTESGWKMIPVEPEFRELSLDQVRILFERRIFAAGPDKELVYFAGLVAGQSLPYRLDHNLSVGMKHALHAASDRTGTTLRASDRRFWKRVWESFLARRQLIGPKQFLRISTPVLGGDVAAADRTLEQFLPQWLEADPYPSSLSVHR